MRKQGMRRGPWQAMQRWLRCCGGCIPPPSRGQATSSWRRAEAGKERTLDRGPPLLPEARPLGAGPFRGGRPRLPRLSKPLLTCRQEFASPVQTFGTHNFQFFPRFSFFLLLHSVAIFFFFPLHSVAFLFFLIQG